jgi:hypothetical protein
MSSQVLSREFEALKTDLIQAYDAKGMRASGKFAETLEVKVTGLTAQLWGENYAQQLETGRKSGKFPPIDAIKKWIEDKGIASRIQGEISISSLAFLIARKIAREGWKREQFGGVELISEVVTEQRMQKIIDEVGAEQALIYSTEIIKITQELAI